MNELDDIQASLASFTRNFSENADHSFSELRRSSFFDPIPNEWLRLIAEQVKIRSFRAGDCLTHDGEPLSSFFVILFGTTTVYVHEEIVGTIVGGECIGEGAFFANTNILRTATVVADEDVIVAEIDRDGISQLQRNEELMNYMNKALLLALFKKLQGANRRIQDLIE